MFKKELIILAIVCSAAPFAVSADYPAEIHGKWGTSPEYCPTLEIDKKYSKQGTEMTCEALSVKASGSKFTIKEKCSGVAGAGTGNTVYVMSGDTLIVTFGPSVVRHQRCGAASAAPASSAAQDGGSTMTCTVNEGQAGVTTFLDAKLKKQGSTIRDFDNYVFKADKKIKVGKTDALVGKLLNGDGTVAEPKSYAYADEWSCK
jgi:hypothetical protein